MFCKQCGKKVASGSPRCPHCGRAADVLSGGTGFWDLTSPPEITAPVSAPVATTQIPEPQPVPQPVPQPMAQSAPQPVSRPVIPPVTQTPPIVEPDISRKSRKNPIGPLVILAGIVILILVIALAVTAVRAGRLADQLEEANAALTLQEAEETEPESQEAPAPAPVPSPAITPNPSEEPTPEPSPSEKPESSPAPSPSPSEKPDPSEEPEYSEAPEEAQFGGNDNVAENPLLPLTAEFSEDMNGVVLTVEPGELKVTEYQWIIVYDTGLRTVEDCLKVLSDAQLQEDPTLKSVLRDQVDPYDHSSGDAVQELDLTEFYPDSTAYGKRMFCKMTLEDGSVQCSQMVWPGPEAAKDYVDTRQRKDIVTAEVTLPEVPELPALTVGYTAVMSPDQVSAGDMREYEPKMRLEIPVEQGGTYYVVLGTGDAVYPVSVPIIPTEDS